MNEKIINRIFAYLKQKGIPHTRFEKDLGLSNGYLKIQEKRRADLGESVILKIVDYCIDLDIVWLLTGRGSMLRNDGSVRTREESIDTESSLVYKMYKEKDDENKTLIKQNAVLEERIRQLEVDNESLRSQSGADRITDTFTDLPLVDYEEDYPPVESPSSSKHPLAGKA